MIITHASHKKIKKVVADHDCEFYKDCLFFADQGNTYNLTGRCEFQYNLTVDENKIIKLVKRILIIK